MTLSNSSLPVEKIRHSSNYIYYFCLVFVLFPGFLTNAVAIVFIIKDVRKAVFPAIVLLLVLCSADLAAVTFTTIHLSLSQYVTEVTYELCAPLSVLNTFFRLYSGIINIMMSVDRALALCTPYFYKKTILVTTWKSGSVLAALGTALFAFFPIFGLGDVMKTRYINGKPTNACSTFSNHPEGLKKVFGILYGLLGLIIILIIIIANCLVIQSVFKMRKKLISVHPEPSSFSESDSGNKPSMKSFEIAFAKLMGGLAIVYLISGAPYSVGISYHVLFLITKTCLYNFDPLKPHLYTVKLGFTGVYIIIFFFFYFYSKHRLWVLVRTASLRRF